MNYITFSYLYPYKVEENFFNSLKKCIEDFMHIKGLVIPDSKYGIVKYKAYCDFVRNKPFIGLDKYLKDNLNIDVKVENIINNFAIESIDSAGGWTIETIIIHNMNNKNIAFVFDESDCAKKTLEDANKFRVIV